MERKLKIWLLIALGLTAAPSRSVRASRFGAVRHE